MAVIHWFRRDLRLSDNTALAHAAQQGPVVGVYVLSAWKHSHAWTGAKRQQFLCDCLDSLARNLTTLGTALIVRSGDAVTELEQLVQETRATAIYYNRDPDPYGRATEVRLAAMCERLGIRCHGYYDVVLHAPTDVLTAEGKPYRVYTPYANKWLELPKATPLPKPNQLGPAPEVTSLPLPDLGHWGMTLSVDTRIPPGGERAARQRMKNFLTGTLSNYAKHRDWPGTAGTSALSQDLRFGLISIRELYRAAMRQPCDATLKYVQELAWREFYMAILYHWPEVLVEEFNPDWKELVWPGCADAFLAWSEGRTGFPIVDAGMRQLLTTGWMHNRVRMIVAMFLTKDLHCDWRLGEQFFHQHLVDAEIASNNGGWQWSAGTGADAAPYFRIQNPWLQTQRYDPEGRYIKRWLPELADVPAAKLSNPPGDGRPLAPGYPLPIVHHHEARTRTLALFASHKERHGSAPTSGK